ncbi:MAG: hypothetical protein GKR94_16550 [Gammaproteobacteria bacterium]|nr:hypothetical protein [Gammaproteobacteria bacterium]
MASVDDFDRESVDDIARRAIHEIDPEQVPSPALRRLIQDLRQAPDDDLAATTGYNRVHNRHNRGR